MRFDRSLSLAMATMTLGACSLMAGAGGSSTPPSSSSGSGSASAAGESTEASSFSLQQRKEIKEAEASLDEENLPNLNNACGTSIQYDIDWDAFVGTTDNSWSIWRVAVECGGVMDGVTKVCGNDMGKEAVKGRVQTIRCTLDPDATYENLERYGPSLELDGGTLTAGYNRNVGNSSADTKTWLMQNL
jgi:hypothetical protein